MKRSIFLLVLTLLVTACATNPAPAPTGAPPTQAPTWTPQPTYTPRPTYTPFPTPTAMPAATFTPAAATPTPVTYVVQPGDTLNSIAKRYQVAADVLSAANAIQNTDYITAGQVLVIPLAGSTVVSATVSIRATPKPVVRVNVAPPAPAAAAPQLLGMIYPAPPIIQPLPGATLKYSTGGMQPGTSDDITFEWLPVGELEGGAKPCSWAGQANGTTAYIVDRYQIEFNPALITKYGKHSVYHNDHGLNRQFSLLEFQPNVSYTWRVGVGRWCVIPDNQFSNQDPLHQAFLGLISPYTEPRTFMYTQ